MSRWLSSAVAGGALVSALLVAGGVSARTPGGSLDDISNRGRIVLPTPQQETWLRRLKAQGPFRLLGCRGTECFYEFHDSLGWACLDVGTARSLSGGGCGPLLPRLNSPVMDESLYVSRCPTHPPSLYRVAGFAADGVATVSALDTSGRVVAGTRVVGNVYGIDPAGLIGSGPRLYPTLPVVTLIARNSAGNVVWRSPRSPNPNCVHPHPSPPRGV